MSPDEVTCVWTQEDDVWTSECESELYHKFMEDDEPGSHPNEFCPTCGRLVQLDDEEIPPVEFPARKEQCTWIWEPSSSMFKSDCGVMHEFNWLQFHAGVHPTRHCPSCGGKITVPEGEDSPPYAQYGGKV